MVILYYMEVIVIDSLNFLHVIRFPNAICYSTYIILIENVFIVTYFSFLTAPKSCDSVFEKDPKIFYFVHIF